MDYTDESVLEESLSSSLSAAAFGRDMHNQYTNDILADETREESLDTFTCNKALRGPDGEVFRDEWGHSGRPDFVDYENDIIRELKPLHDGETEEDVLLAYEDQLAGYADSYYQAYGVEPMVQLEFYDAL